MRQQFEQTQIFGGKTFVSHLFPALLLREADCAYWSPVDGQLLVKVFCKGGRVLLLRLVQPGGRPVLVSGLRPVDGDAAASHDERESIVVVEQDLTRVEGMRQMFSRRKLN
jgi:hypothetical protein